MTTYNIYKDGLFYGTVIGQKKVAKELGISLGSANDMLKRGGRFGERWYVTRADEKPRTENLIKPKTKTQKEIEYLVYHLNRYGNTCFYKDPDIYANIIMEDYGIKFTKRKVKDNIGEGIADKRRGRPSYFYILERE